MILCMKKADWEIEGKKPASSWPDQGQIRFEGYGTRYREGLDLVVKQINCTINPGEKVFVVCFLFMFFCTFY